MSYESAKKDVETFIIDNWSSTPIFFDSATITGNEAIHISFVPFNRSSYTQNSRSIDETLLKIRFYAANTLACVRLIDEMNLLMDCYSEGNTYSLVGSPDGLGAQNVQSGILELTMNYVLKTYN
jgi:hypothetical protein